MKAGAQSGSGRGLASNRLAADEVALLAVWLAMEARPGGGKGGGYRAAELARPTSAAPRLLM